MHRSKRGRPSPAIIVAVLALVAALGGTAVAEQATTSITKKKTKKIAKRVANKQIALTLPIGSGELATIEERSETFQVAANSTVDQTVNCNQDETVISGGSRWDNFPGQAFVGITQVDKREGNGWRAGGRNFTGATQPFTVYAYCLSTG
jgi:hypothetical protein